MSVLIDTSIWIRFLSDRAPYAPEVDRLLCSHTAVGHILVQGELLMGADVGRTKWLTDYEQLHRASILPHGDVMEFVRARGLQRRGLGWIDAHLLASAVYDQIRLWTADAALTACAQALGIHYELTQSCGKPPLLS